MDLHTQIERLSESGAVMGDLLRTERENHAVTKAQLENALDRLDKLGEDTQGAREQTHLKFPREDYGKPRPITGGSWKADPMMRRIVLAADRSTPVAHFQGVRKVDMELMALAPDLAAELSNCYRHLFKVAVADDLLVPYVQYLEGGIIHQLHLMGARGGK